MILETAILDVNPGRSADFERSFSEASPLLAATPGYQRHELRSSVEKRDRYLLLVWWDTLESHTEGFRGSERYADWSALLHDYYDPFPEVEHYRLLD